MATKETKPETKKTQQKQTQQINEDHPSLPLPYKTCSFKASIHCEGCKRKVKKILTSIEGVYRVDIDVKLHKVTVMGIVSPEILLKKLLKAGKNAELLPDIPDPVEPKPKPVNPTEKTKTKNKTKNKNNKEETEVIDKASSSGSVEPESDSTGSTDCNKPESEKTGNKPESVKTGAKPEPEKTETGECGSGSGDEIGSVKEEKKDVVKEKDSVPAESPVPAVEKKAEESGGAVSGNVGKKKKKKGQNLKTPPDGPVRTQSLPLPTTANHDRPFYLNDDQQILANNYPPRHDMYPYPAPPSYYAPQVMYGVSYNVAQAPVSVDAASYYTPPPPYSYAYMHPGYQPSDQNAYQSRPSDSFELFSDENPNGCSVM